MTAYSADLLEKFLLDFICDSSGSLDYDPDPAQILRAGEDGPGITRVLRRGAQRGEVSARSGEGMGALQGEAIGPASAAKLVPLAG